MQSPTCRQDPKLVSGAKLVSCDKKVELKPQKAETMKSHPYIKVALAGIFLFLCANVGSLAASLASKETCVMGVALLEEGQEVWV
eukprot:scaffold42102_cov18-Phaeocystis_antarctica.AAC.1